MERVRRLFYVEVSADEEDLPSPSDLLWALRPELRVGTDSDGWLVDDVVLDDEYTIHEEPVALFDDDGDWIEQ